jgi:hypothetical protein
LGISTFASLKRQNSAGRLKQLVFLHALLHQELLSKTLKVAQLEVFRQAPRNWIVRLQSVEAGVTVAGFGSMAIRPLFGMNVSISGNDGRLLPFGLSHPRLGVAPIG